ncbi:hypothetical protein [Neobacillus ginsengisoli]|uniref:Lipoprotein n=1 Tax=Neobacillus ginsengisoli TaxID=904295 RepID=A0ABT9Y1M4_9BACI|nr:hypothetical protein [Neobacillus ginsengisoli]MDQ0201727.1 hypothetical protein [Neobacillus ginsengisoli]
MKKKACIVSMCLLLFFLTSCMKTSNQSTKNVSSSNSTTSSNLKKNTELKGQDVSDITKLITPDELVYLHDGVKKTYTKEDQKFQTIIQLNNKRQTKKLGALKTELIYSNGFPSHGDYLIYKFTNTNYAPIYFELVPSPDERFENSVVNYYGSNTLPSYVKKDDPTKFRTYGHLAPADELLAHLNAKLKN